MCAGPQGAGCGLCPSRINGCCQLLVTFFGHALDMTTRRPLKNGSWGSISHDIFHGWAWGRRRFWAAENLKVGPLRHSAGCRDRAKDPDHQQQPESNLAGREVAAGSVLWAWSSTVQVIFDASGYVVSQECQQVGGTAAESKPLHGIVTTLQLVKRWRVKC